MLADEALLLKPVTAPDAPKLNVTEPGLTAVIVEAPIVPLPDVALPAEVRVSAHPEVLEDKVGVPLMVPLPAVTRLNPLGTRTVPAMVMLPLSVLLPITIVPAVAMRLIIVWATAKPPLAPLPMFIAVLDVYGCRVNTPLVEFTSAVPVKVMLLDCKERFVIELLPKTVLVGTVIPEALPLITDKLCTTLPMLST